MNIREMREESLKIATRAEALLGTFTADNAAEKNIEFDAMMTASDELVQRANKAEAVEARKREFTQIDTPMADSRIDVRSGDTAEEKRTESFNAYLRGEISEREYRAMGTTVAAKGGFTVPTTFASQLISSLQTRGPMLDPTVVNFIQTEGGNPIQYAKFDDTAKATIIGENLEIPKVDLSFGQATLGAFKYTSGIVLVSRELLEDSGIPVDGTVSSAIAARISRGVNEHLTSGAATATQPTGIVTAAPVGKTTAVAGAITSDELIDLIHSIDPAYRNAARFMLADSVVAGVRKLKDSTGQYIWQAGMSVSNPETLFGRAFVVNPDMPAIATGAKTVLYGDFKAYTVRQARGIEVRRLEERFADFDQVGYVSLARFDGLLTDLGAVRALKQA
jgi:HK97 family phage major capsid protein